MFNLKKLINYSLLLFIIILGILGNYVKFPLYSGFNFTFGSIFILFIIRIYGMTFGVAASIVISLYAYLFNQSSIDVFIFVVEAVFVGIFFKYRKENMILIDVFFWTFIGMPIIWIVCKLLNYGNLFILSMMFKISINGIFNTLIASIFTSYFLINKIMDNEKTDNAVFFEEMISNLAVGAVISSSIIISIINDIDNANTAFENFRTIVILILLYLLFSMTLSKIILNPIFRLSKIATYLHKKVFYYRSIRWPNSKIYEINSLIKSFKYMNSTLNKNFQELKCENERLEKLVYQDTLTGLPNRIKFKDKVNISLNQAREYKDKLAILFIDLDGFKRINDTLGHDVGDQLLKEFSERLLGCIGKEDVVFRFGGDEFTILLPTISDEQYVKSVADSVIKSMEKPCILNGQEFHITSSIGISIFPNDGETSEVLLKNSDIAMYRAKEQGKNNYQFYTSDINSISFENLVLESKLHKALDKNELQLYYQPQIDLNNGQMIGMEALLRWINPELGMISPGKFIPIAEETGLIIPIGEWVLRSACKQNKKWQELGFKPIRVAVNISAHQFQQHDFVEKVKVILNETELDPIWLEIEITESIAIKNVDFTIKTLNKLKQMGIKVSMDDFGTGFSSLGYLKNFKIDTLKIDYSFVRDIGIDSDNESIIKAIIMLAKNLKLNVIAEGVETEQQLLFLKEENCNESQGYLFSKPLCAGDFESLLNKHNVFSFV